MKVVLSEIQRRALAWLYPTPVSTVIRNANTERTDRFMSFGTDNGFPCSGIADCALQDNSTGNYPIDKI